MGGSTKINRNWFAFDRNERCEMPEGELAAAREAEVKDNMQARNREHHEAMKRARDFVSTFD